MRISTKHSGILTTKKWMRFTKKAKEIYPEYNWEVHGVSDEINDTYGEGKLVVASKGVHKVEYFILSEDPRVDKWRDFMASQLKEKVDGQFTR